MTNEDKFKNRVNDLLNEQQYAYDADNWETASHALDAEDARKKRRFFFFLLSGLGAGLLLTGYLLFPVSQPKTTAIARTSDATNEAPVKADSQPAIAQSPIIQKPATQAPDVKDTKNKTTEKNNLPTGKTERSKQPQPVQPLTTVGALPEKSAQHKQPAPANSVAVPSLAPTAVSGSTKNQVPTNTSATNTKTTDHPTETPAASNADKKDESDLTHAAAIPQQDAPPGFIPQREETGQQGSQGIPVPDSLAVNKQPQNKPVEPIAAIDTTANSPVAMQAPVDTTVKALSQSTAIPLPKTTFCYVEAGAYFNLGWRYKGAGEGASLNPYLSFNYIAKLSDKASFSIGAGYTTLSGLKLDNKMIRSSKVVFGEQYDVTSITPATLNYFLIPVKLHYAIGQKQSVTIGYTAGYLLDVQSNVDTYTEVLGKQLDKKSYSTGGYVEGFKTFSSQLSIGYRRSLYGNFWVNGEFLFGLTDLRDNTFFGINLRERMTGVKISITYDLLKK